MDVFWYPEPARTERAEFEAWLVANDCSDVAVLAIGATTIFAYGTNNATRGWGSSELRKRHSDLPSALTALCCRLRGREGTE
jgi:hypothetical protein